jgi:putative Holliday junction resolvase
MLGLDIGDRRIGIAAADALGLTAQGLPTLERKSLAYDLDYLEKVIRQRQVNTLVVGLPRNMDGSFGPQSEKVKAFVQALMDHLEKSVAAASETSQKAAAPNISHLSVIYWDERLTTVAAHRSMLEGDLSRRKRKESVDRISAVLILQGYLDRLAIQKKRSETPAGDGKDQGND